LINTEEGRLCALVHTRAVLTPCPGAAFSGINGSHDNSPSCWAGSVVPPLATRQFPSLLGAASACAFKPRFQEQLAATFFFGLSRVPIAIFNSERLSNLRPVAFHPILAD